MTQSTPDPGTDISIDDAQLDLEDAAPVQDEDAYEGDSTLAGLGGTEQEEGGAG